MHLANHRLGSHAIPERAFDFTFGCQDPTLLYCTDQQVSATLECRFEQLEDVRLSISDYDDLATLESFRCGVGRFITANPLVTFLLLDR